MDDGRTKLPPTTTTFGADIPRRKISDLIESSDELFDLFDKYQVLHLSKCPDTVENGTNDFTWKDIQKLFLGLSDGDKESWCIETTRSAAENEDANPETSSEDFLKPHLIDDTSAYCSFLVQKDTAALKSLLPRLPVDTLNQGWHHEPCIWMFFGRNHHSEKRSNGEYDLQGRPEHTDSISHDGTWHYQLSGTKRWLIRPTSKLLARFREHLDPTAFEEWNKTFSNEDNENVDIKRVSVDCNEGDILVVNTRLWFHQTILPSQPEPSVSYARDFWARKKPSENTDEVTENSKSSSEGMTNVDGLYATDDIEAGTVIFREDDMPDCELHRSKENYNCEIAELEDGVQAVVSTRNIAAGEFFCIAESDDEDEEEWDEEEVSDGEDEQD